MLLTGWLLAGLAPTAQAGLFTGDLGTNNWEQILLDANDGGFVFTGTGDTIELDLTASAIPGFSDTLIGLKSPYSSTPEVVDFNWTLTFNGNAGPPQAYFYVGAPSDPNFMAYALPDTSGFLTGIEIPANTPIYFELVGDVTPGKSPAQLEVTVPEPGNLLASMLVLAGGFEWFRRKRKAGG